MFARRDVSWFACSPDGIILIDFQHLFVILNIVDRNADEHRAVAVLEIKTRVAASSIGAHFTSASTASSTTPILCSFGDYRCCDLVPEEHRGQLLFNAWIMNVRWVLYVSAFEDGIGYMVLIELKDADVDTCQRVLHRDCDGLLEWAHTDAEPVIPPWCTREHRSVLKSYLPLWRVVDHSVRVNRRPFPPLLLFKHAVQVLYSKLKCGVDGMTQWRQVLQSQGSALKWEQKLGVQCVKSLVINAFIAHRISTNHEMLSNSESFKSLQHFLDCMNKTNSLSTFIWHGMRELLEFASMDPDHVNHVHPPIVGAERE